MEEKRRDALGRDKKRLEARSLRYDPFFLEAAARKRSWNEEGRKRRSAGPFTCQGYFRYRVFRRCKRTGGAYVFHVCSETRQQQAALSFWCAGCLEKVGVKLIERIFRGRIRDWKWFANVRQEIGDSGGIYVENLKMAKERILEVELILITVKVSNS